MTEPLVSVIMSTYNESLDELRKSVDSVLNQTYKNFEFIIINDNPLNTEIKQYLQGVQDNRVFLYFNDENVGLIASLNKALKHVHGEYVARMDADDIAKPTRIFDEYKYLISNNLDMVGSFVELIDQNDRTIQAVMKMPIEHFRIKKFIKWGSCLCHPTWLIKKEVYDALNGYRNAKYCEDYDFILRAINFGYILGNIPEVELSYRIRKEGVSKTNSAKQYLLREYLAKSYRNGLICSDDDIQEYLTSSEFQADCIKYEHYKEKKSRIRHGGVSSVFFAFSLIVNKYFWKDLNEKIKLKERER